MFSGKKQFNIGKLAPVSLLTYIRIRTLNQIFEESKIMKNLYF